MGGTSCRREGEATVQRASTSTTAAKADRPFFGRRDDLDYLLERVRAPGFTVVLGPPQIGKTRLLEETRSRLIDEDRVVGLAESTGRHCDLLLLALRAAYAQAATSDKLGVLIDEARENRLGVLDGVSAGTLAVVLPDQLRLVVAAQHSAPAMRSVTLQAAALTGHEALSLASFLTSAGDQPLVLVLDAWERSLFAPGLDAIRDLVGHTGARPGCHVVLGVTMHEPLDAPARLRLIGTADGASAAARELGPMDLRDPAEQARLADYLTGRVPATGETGRSAILELLGGLPAVLHRWLQAKPTTAEDLARLADEARRGTYPELRPLLLERCRESVRTAGFLAALALVPRMVDDETWSSLSLTLLGGATHDVVPALRRLGVLEADGDFADVASYGHEARHDAAAGAWLDDDGSALRSVARNEVKRLVPELAAHVRDFGWQSYLHAAALAAVHGHARELHLRGELLTVCGCAASLFPSWSVPAGSHPLRGKAGDTVRHCPDALTLVALALVNAVCSAGAAEDQTARDDLLDELRRLSERHGDDEPVRELLAVALADRARRAFGAGDPERRDALLKELSRLCSGHPREAGVCAHLGEALSDSIDQACRLKDHTSRDALLKGLRSLCSAHPGDATVREHLAVALVNGIDEACDEADQACRDTLIEELRTLCAEHPGDALVREQLAVALLDAVEQASHDRHRARRNSLLQALRGLAVEHPGDAAVRERLGAALATGVTGAIWEGDRAFGEALLKELRELCAQAPADLRICEQLSAALSDDLTRARWSEDWPRYEALLDELRALCARHPDDDVVFDRLAAALSHPPAAPPSSRT